MSAYCVDPLVSNGCKAIVVEYDLCPTVTLSDLIKQITKCGVFILEYAKRVKCRQVFSLRSIQRTVNTNGTVENSIMCEVGPRFMHQAKLVVMFLGAPRFFLVYNKIFWQTIIFVGVNV